MESDLQILAEQYVSDPTPARREALVLAAVPLVRSIVDRIPAPKNVLAEQDDLQSIGMLGLLQALDSYDPAQGTAFASYCFGRVRGALVDHMRSIDTLSRDKRRKLALVNKTADQLRQQLGREPSARDISEAADVPEDDYHALVQESRGRFNMSLHEQTNDEDAPSPVEIIPHPAAREAFDRIEQDSLLDYIGVLLRHMPEREQHIVALYYFENLTLREIAEMMHLTEARISQILKKTLKTLRSQLEQQANIRRAA